MWKAHNINHRDQLNYKLCLDILCEFIHQDDKRDDEENNILTTQDYTVYDFQVWLWKKIGNRKI